MLILDEPFNGVDVETSEKMDIIIQRLKQKNKIILLSSHIINSLTHLCDDIFLLNNGCIEKTFLPAEYTDLTTSFKEAISGQIKNTLDQLLPEK